MSLRMFLGTRKGLVVYTQTPGGWRLESVHHVGNPVSYAVEDPRNGTWWAALDHGHWGQKLQRSRDQGQSWEEVKAPAYPEDAERGDGKPATLEYIWLIAPGPASQPGRLYLGTNPGGLFVSDDGGDTFTLCRGLWDHPSRTQWTGGGKDTPGIHSLVIHPAGPDHLMVGVSCGGVFESRDGGLSWAPKTKGLLATFLPDPEAEIGHDPHLIVACPTRPEVLWQQNHCGVFRSVNGGERWAEVSAGPPRFGFAVAVDEVNPDRAWLVPAVSDERRNAASGGLSVSTTADGGVTWRELRDGLPQEGCFDLVYRHSLDKRGPTLAFASTTGNLYVSEDFGERWALLSHTLAPVYSLRFGA